MGFLLANKSYIENLPNYLDYADIFLFDLAIELYENIFINKYVIKLGKDKQAPYEPIHSLRLVEQKTSKIYIETDLKTGFIQLFKFIVGVPIFFNKIEIETFIFTSITKV